LNALQDPNVKQLIDDLLSDKHRLTKARQKVNEPTDSLLSTENGTKVVEKAKLTAVETQTNLTFKDGVT